MTRFLTLLTLLALSGCASSGSRCLLDSQRPTTVTELFFGRDIPGRGPLTDNEWTDFAASVIAMEFPEGFTVLDGDGEWRDPATQTMSRERTKILIVATARPTDLASRISRIRDTYSRLYRQTSVGVLTHDGCGQF
jgi:hypothetical protein